MEQLQSLLREYNLSHYDNIVNISWAKQFLKHDFPKYWKLVYEILSKLPKSSRVIEIGCGLGDISAILCYLQFRDICAFERDERLAFLAGEKISELFNHRGIVIPSSYPDNQVTYADILLLVNCVYTEDLKTKDEYLSLLKSFYYAAGEPSYYIMEVIDNSYTISDSDFPEFVRLSHDDIISLFPHSKITSWSTYVYPKNKKSKTLYLIEKE